MSFICIYVTIKNEAEAKLIARKILEQKLAACANVYPKVSSLYWWNDKINAENESVLILKTKTANFDLISAQIKSMHSYDCPCIISLPIENGSPEYLNWLERSMS